MWIETRNRPDEAEQAEMEEMVIGVIVAGALIAVMFVGGLGALVQTMIWILGLAFIGWVVRLMLG